MDLNGPSTPLRDLAIPSRHCQYSATPVAERSRSPDVNGPSTPLRNLAIRCHSRRISTALRLRSGTLPFHPVIVSTLLPRWLSGVEAWWHCGSQRPFGSAQGPCHSIPSLRVLSTPVAERSRSLVAERSRSLVAERSRSPDVYSLRGGGPPIMRVASPMI